MKKNILALLVIQILVLFSCTKDNDKHINNNGHNILLTAPSGNKIASSIQSLSKKIKSSHLQSLSLEDEIVKIEYLPFKKGIGALVYYKTKDGKLSNLFYASGIRFGIKEKIIDDNKSAKLSTEEKKEYIIFKSIPETSFGTFKCNGPACCIVGIDYSGDDWIITCGCDSFCKVSQGEQQTS